MKTLIISTMLFFAINLYAAPKKDFPIGKITMLRGKVSALQPHTLDAVILKKGDFVYEDSSLLASAKSFAKIKLINDSFITIGPKSKVIVNLVKKKGATVISLLKGVVRATVERKGNKHFFVKTRTAALGVRGTEFMTTYNNDSQKTSLLIYKGSVAIKKIQKKIIINNESTDQQKKEVVYKIQALLKEQPIIAKIGEFTNVGTIKDEAAQVVQINIRQLTKLKLDKTMGVEKLVITKKVLEKEEQLIKQEVAKVLKEQPVVAQKKSKLLKGGFIDLGTGIYIPPKKKGEVVGTISDNGTFVPPTGLKMDAHKGFVALTENNADKAEELNEQLADQVEAIPENPAYRRYFDTED